MKKKPFKAIIRSIFIFLYIIFGIIYFLLPPIGVILLAGLTTYLIYSFFTHHVKKDKVAWVLFGGKPVDQVGKGYHLIPSGLFELEIVEKRIQFRIGPFKEEMNTPAEYRRILNPLALKPSSSPDATALQKVLTFTPTIALNIELENLDKLEGAGNVKEAVDLASEVIVANLQGLVSLISLEEFVARSADIADVLSIYLNNTLLDTGISPDGNMKFENLGIPADLSQSAQDAARAVTDSQKAVTEGDAAAKIRERNAAALRIELQVEADGQRAKGEAEAASIAAKVAALPGTAAQKAAVLIAEKTKLPPLPVKLNTLFLNQGGGDKTDPTAATIAATAAALKANTPPKEEKKKS